MKILFVSYKLSGGGAERVISVLASQMVQMNHNIGIILYERTLDEYPLNSNVDLFELKMYNQKNIGNRIRKKFHRIKQIKKLITDYSPDIIIPFLDSMVEETFYAVRGMNIPVIATVRNNPQKENKIYKIYRNFIFSKCYAVFLQNKEQSFFFNKKIRKKSFVVPNPINEEALTIGKNRTLHPQIKNIITCGRLEDQKNHVLLIQSMKLVHEKYPDVRLYIYGEGTKKASLEKLINNINANNYIFLNGRTNSIYNVLEKADLFVLSSDYEGMPNVLMEAMACGLPCISTDCPTGPKELIGENERGVLVPVKDEIKLYEAICNMISEPIKAYEIGNEAHNFIKAFYSPYEISNKLLLEINKIKP